MPLVGLTFRLTCDHYILSVCITSLSFYHIPFPLPSSLLTDRIASAFAFLHDHTKIAHVPTRSHSRSAYIRVNVTMCTSCLYCHVNYDRSITSKLSLIYHHTVRPLGPVYSGKQSRYMQLPMNYTCNMYKTQVLCLRKC